MLMVNQLAGFGAYQSAGTTPLLDLIGTAANAGYSVRKLRTAYAGSALRVRRSSDSTEQDIGFSGTDLDSASLISFCGAGDGFVKTWYDQSGNARDITQGTAANQPQIVSSGALISTFSAKGSLSFDGSNDLLSTASAVSSFISASAYTYFFAGRVTSGTNTGSQWTEAAFCGDSAGFWTCATSSVSGVQFHHYDGTNDSANAATSYPFSGLVLGKYDGTNIKGYIGGGTGASTAQGNITNVTNVLRVGESSSGYLTGFIGEALFFASALSVSDCNILANDQASYWSQSWSNIS